MLKTFTSLSIQTLYTKTNYVTNKKEVDIEAENRSKMVLPLDLQQAFYPPKLLD